MPVLKHSRSGLRASDPLSRGAMRLCDKESRRRMVYIGESLPRPPTISAVPQTSTSTQSRRRPSRHKPSADSSTRPTPPGARPDRAYRDCDECTADFHTLLVGKDVEVIEPMLPEGTQPHPARYRDLQRLHHNRKISSRRITHQEVDVLGHDDVGIDLEPILHSRHLQTSLKDQPRLRRGEVRPATVAGGVTKWRSPWP